MIPCLTCESARELLEPFVDNELGTGDQVAVETHLRSCRTCAARIDDMALIGWSLRAGTPAITPRIGDVRELAIVQSAVLTRINTEREQSLRVRLPALFDDMRFLWPAMGATTAVLMCLWGAMTVWHLTRQTTPDSVAAMLQTLAPGTERNPLRIGTGMLVPRVVDQGFMPEKISAEEWQLAVAAIVSRTGHIGGAEFVVPASSAVLKASDRQAVLEAVRHSRYTPAQSPDGRPVAVKAVLLLVQTTIREPRRPIDTAFSPRETEHASETVKTRPPAAPSDVRSSLLSASPTA